MSKSVLRELPITILLLFLLPFATVAPAQEARPDTSALVTGTPAATAATPARDPSVPPPSIYGSMLQDEQSTGPIMLEAGPYAVFHTSDGDYLVKLFSREAPNTVANFIELAQGRKPWKHPVTLVESTRPIFNNTTIYRIIPNSMIFGGDPINKGQGDSGTLLPLETSPELRFDGPGYIAMDGNGTQASGSRWFIVLRPFPDRTGNYTIFGKVVGGLDVVRKISNKPTRRPQSPLDPTLLSSIEVFEIPQGKRTRASFQVEDGRQVLSIDSSFEDAPPPAPAPVAVVDTTTTATATETTATATPAP